MIESLLKEIDRFDVKPVVKSLIEKEKFIKETEIIMNNVTIYNILHFAFSLKEKKFKYIEFNNNEENDELLYNVYITIDSEKKHTKLIEAYINLKETNVDFDHNFEYFCELLKKEIIKSEKRNLNALKKSMDLFDKNPTYKLQDKISELVFKYHLVEKDIDPKYLFLDSNYYYNNYVSKIIRDSINLRINKKDIDIMNKNMLFNLFNIDYNKNYNRMYQEFYSIMFDSKYFKPYTSFISYLKNLLINDEKIFNKFINVLIGKFRSYNNFYYDEDRKAIPNIFVDASLENYALIKSEIAEIIVSRNSPIIDIDNILSRTQSPLINISQSSMLNFLKRSTFLISMKSMKNLEKCQYDFLKKLIYETKSEFTINNEFIDRLSTDDLNYLLNKKRIYCDKFFDINSYITFSMINYVNAQEPVLDSDLDKIKDKINLLQDSNIEYINPATISKNVF